MLVSLVEAAGHRAYVSGSVDDALTAIEEFDFDLLLINADEPDKELLDFVKLLRFAQMGGPPLPIVVLTACCDETKRLDRQEAGIDLVLEKPISPADLLRAIVSWAAPERRRGTAHDR
jgi:DNA-binding response OmpR family regulator